MVIINKKELAGRLILGNTVKFSVSKKQERVNVLVRDAAFIANNGGRFELMDEFFAAVKVSDEQNEAFYSAMTPMMKITPKDVLVGECIRQRGR
jgi:translation elongation factor P/translation initiation factor 5A